MGATLGNIEFCSQTNNNTDCVSPEDRFKWVDDLTVLEKINLLNIGLSSYNYKQHVPSDSNTHGQFVNNQELKTQLYLDKINQWTLNQNMQINKKKTNAMLINFTRNYQFTSRLQVQGQQIELVEQMQILGVTVTSQLNWDENTLILV